jgi:asparagine synthase (glutamine-hydrolysing)
LFCPEWMVRALTRRFPEMAHFLLIIDADVPRRDAAARRAQRECAFLAHLKTTLSLQPRYAIAWSAAPSAPVSHAVTPNEAGPDCILFGEPHSASGEIASAESLRSAHAVDWSRRNALNGFYCALLVDPNRGVRAESDALGIFPVYYWKRADVLLISSSPGLFRSHPAFTQALDVHGVAALLLTSGLVGGRTLSTGVRRLSADHVLLSVLDAPVLEDAPPASEEASIEIDLEEASIEIDLEEAVEHAFSLHRAFLQTALRSSRSPGLQLSGGLDSRLLAGITAELQLQPAAITFGRNGDLDAYCATQVATELGFPLTRWDVHAEDYPSFALASVNQENLSGGLYALPMGWNLSVRPPALSVDRMVCGLTLDAVIGGPKQVARADGPITFEQLRIGGLGWSRDVLNRLVSNPELSRACEDVREELWSAYVTGAPSDYLREWRMNLAHRHRFAVGACAWRYSLFAWPVMPALDRSLIRFTRRLPYSLVQNRRIQTHMLVSRFPRLAKLDLDRNYLDTIPLIGARKSLIYDIQRRAVKLTRRVRARLGDDPRFYVRTMDFNSPGWNAIRTVAEDSRRLAGSLLKLQVLEEVLPKPGVRVRNLSDPISHSTPLKNTLGLMLWLRQHA